MNPLRAWNLFWFRPISARPLCAFRVVVGVLTLAHLGLLSVDLDYWLSDSGILQGAEARTLAGPLRPSPLQWVQDPVSVRTFVALSGLVAFLFTIGWRTRVMGVLLYLALLSIHHRNILTNCGPDNLLLILVFYLMLSPCGVAYSLDARRARLRRGTEAEPIIVPWAQRLIQIQLCLIYFDTSILKCNGSTWLGGTALHYVLNNPEVGRLDFRFLCQHPLLLNLLTHTALLVEFGLAFLLWNRATRAWMAIAGIVLHAGVLLVVNVPLFGELMTACYLTFLTPGELDTLLRVLNPVRLFRRSARASFDGKARLDAREGSSPPHLSGPDSVRSSARVGIED
ncbi:MAG: hypothetical protein NVSMB9_25250 [Isosphaeraceae bacterium]